MGNSKGYKNGLIPLIIRKSVSKQFICEYNKKYSGKPTAENLSKWRDGFNQSLKPGGANEHLTVSAWLQCGIEIYNQITGEVICTHNPPMFEVIND